MLTGYATSDVVLTVREAAYAAGDVILVDASNAAGDQLTPGVVTGADYDDDRIVYATRAGVDAAPPRWLRTPCSDA